MDNDTSRAVALLQVELDKLRAAATATANKIAGIELAIEALGGGAVPAADTKPPRGKARTLDKAAQVKTVEYVAARSAAGKAATAKGLAREYRISRAAARQRLCKAAKIGSIVKNGEGYKIADDKAAP